MLKTTTGWSDWVGWTVVGIGRETGSETRSADRRSIKGRDVDGSKKTDSAIQRNKFSIKV